MDLDPVAAVGRLTRFLAVGGVTGREAAISADVRAALGEAGVPARAVKTDDVNTRIPLPTETGNLVVQLPGVGRLKAADRLLFMAHLDTVPLAAGAVPRVRGKRIVNETPGAALGGDNRTGCAVLVTLAAELIAHKLPHPPLTFLFTVREESGLFGARHLDPAVLGGPVMGFNFDGGSAAEVTVGAVGADRWEADITGKAAHAGVHPERGVSATMVLALALAEVRAGGWFGKVSKDGREGTSNVGSVGSADDKCAGEATNVVTDFVRVRGECRSHDPKFCKEITAAYKTAFANAAAAVTDHAGKPAKVKVTARTDYFPFRLADTAPVVRRAANGVRAVGREPALRATNGGLDANWVCKHGVPTVTFGAGQNAIHTADEWVDLAEFEAACQLAVVLATAE